MKTIKQTVQFFGGIAILMSISLAHHAMEYIEMESYSTTRSGEKVFHLHYDYMVDNYANPAEDHWEFTPGLSYGITNRLMVDAHTHFAKFGFDHLIDQQSDYDPWGPTPFMEAMAFAVQYRFTEGSIVDVAVAGIYEEPFQRSRDLLDGQRVFEGILILSKNFTVHSNICANLKLGKDGNEAVKEWALGAKTPLSQDPHGVRAGVEILGDTEGNWSLLPGVYLPVGAENIIFKTGLEFGSGMKSMRVNVTFMVRF